MLSTEQTGVKVEVQCQTNDSWVETTAVQFNVADRREHNKNVGNDAFPQKYSTALFEVS